jgi:AcrR family transcriptional regulator
MLDSQPKSPSGTGIEARRERQRLEARRSILDASHSLLVESEVGDFSIRGLADRCGYSPPTIYYHFGDKDGLLAALLDDRLAALTDELDTACRSDDSLERLRSILLTFVRHAVDHPTFSGLLETVGRQPDSRVHSSLQEIKERLDAPLQQLIDSGELQGFDTSSAEQVLWAMLHGLIAIQRAEPDHPWARGLAELAFDSLLRGMTRPSDPEGAAR